MGATAEGQVSDWTSVGPGEAVDRPMPSGWTLPLPVVYEDWAWGSAFFAARESAVRDRLPDPALQPLRLLPGVALVVVGLMRYTKITGVDPYDELVVGFPVERGPGRSWPGKAALVSPALHPEKYHRAGFYVQHLPVSHPRALEFGVELWGYPKTVARFDWSATPGAMTGAVGGLTLRVPKLPGPFTRVEQVTYTVQNGAVVETPVRFEGRFRVRLSSRGTKLKLGDDPISRDVAAMLCWPFALGSMYAEVARSVLYDARSREPLPLPPAPAGA